MPAPEEGGPPRVLFTGTLSYPPNSQGILLTNLGTFETRPTLTVQGPVSGPVVTNGATGQAISWSGLVLGASDVLTINLDARQAYVAGVFVPADASSSWVVLEPGAAEISLTGAGAGGAVLSATYSSAWI